MSKPKKLSLKQLQKMFISGGLTEIQLRTQLENMYVPAQIELIVTETKRMKDASEALPEREAQPKLRYVSSFTVANSVFESIIDGVFPSFLRYSVAKDEWEIEKEYDLGDETLLPLGLGTYPYPSYYLNTAIFDALKRRAYRSTLNDLYHEILEEFNTFIDAPSQYKALGASFILETYLQHKFDAMSYPFLLGDIDSGKSRFLELIKNLAYRPMMTAYLNEANVYNFIGDREEGNCTILEDEAHLLSREKNIDKLGIYRSGYRRGSVVPRILDASSSERKQKFYKVYCSKAFAGYYLPNDEAFKTRCIPIYMVWGQPSKDKFEDEDRDRFRSLRFKLFIYRMIHYFDPPPKVELGMSGRLREVWESKVQAVVGTDGEEIMRNMAENYRNMKMEERNQSLEAYITRTLLILAEQYPTQISFSTIYNSLLKILGETEHIGETSYNSDFLGRKISRRGVGLKLGSIFNGRKEQIFGKGRVWTFDTRVLNKLRTKYAVDDKELQEIKVILAMISADEDERKQAAEELFK